MNSDLGNIRKSLATVAKLRRLFEQWRSDFDGCKKSPWELRSDFVWLSKLCAESLKLMPGMVHLGWFDDPVQSHLTDVVIYNAGVCDAVKKNTGCGDADTKKTAKASDPIRIWVDGAQVLDRDAEFELTEPGNGGTRNQAGECSSSGDRRAATDRWSRMITQLFQAMEGSRITVKQYEETIAEMSETGGGNARPELFDEIEALLQELGKLFHSWSEKPHEDKWNEAWRRVAEGSASSKGGSLAKRVSAVLNQAAALVTAAVESGHGGGLVRVQWELYSRPPANRAWVKNIGDAFISAIHAVDVHIAALDKDVHWEPDDWSHYLDTLSTQLARIDALLHNIDMTLSPAMPGGVAKWEESDLAILRSLKSLGAMPRGSKCAQSDDIAKAIHQRNNSNLRQRLSKLVKGRLIETVSRKGYRLTSDGEADSSPVFPLGLGVGQQCSEDQVDFKA